MNFFAVYDPATGAIARYGWCALAGDIAHQAQAGEAAIGHTELPRSGRFRIDITATPHRVVATA